MLGRYYVITLNCGSRLVPHNAIQAVLNQHEDWLRFANDCYFVFSRWSNAKQIYEQVKPLLNTQDFVIVTQVEMGEVHGWGSQAAVNWFGKLRV